METLQKALRNVDSSNVDGMKKITSIIADILAKEKTNVERILAEENEHVKKLQERLQSLQDNPKDGEAMNLNQSNEQLWRNFDLQRTGVIEEIGGYRNETTVSLTEKESTSLKNTANAVLSLCLKECKNQKEKLLAAVTGKPVNEISSNELNELSDKIETFQLELESDVVPYLMENLCKSLSSEKFKTHVFPVVITRTKSDWTLNINKSKDIKLTGSKFEKYMKACIKICWQLVNHQHPAEFVWDVSGNEHSFKCLTTSCNKQPGCDSRVCRPAVYRGREQITEGKYTCMSCTPGNICNNPGENESAKSKNGKSRKSAPIQMAVRHDTGKQRNSTSSKAAESTGAHRKSLDF